MSKARINVEKLREIVSVRDFGAVGDGAADDTSALQAALNAMTDGGELFFPPGTYKITAGLSKTYNDNVHVALRGYGAKIDATASTTLEAIKLGGSRGSGTGLGGTVSRYATSFTVNNAAALTADKIVLITSTDLWNPTNAQYRKGEFVLIEQVVSTTITASNSLYDGYTAATTTVHLCDMPQITVEGLEIECNGDVIALKIEYARNPTVRNCKVHGSRYSGISVGYCLGGLIDSNFVYDVWNGTVTGTSYGVVVGTGQGVKVTNNTIYNARHAISGGGFEPTRELIYAHNTCHNSTREDQVGAIDLHGNCEFCLITNNVASSVLCGGINAIITNNIINNSEPDVPGVYVFQTISSDYFNISGNSIICTGANSQGIWVAPRTTNVNIQQLLIANNAIKTVTVGILCAPGNSTFTGASITAAAIKDNLVRNSGAAQAIQMRDQGAATYAITNARLSGNVFEAATHDAAGLGGTGIVNLVSVGDIFRGNRLNGYLAEFGGTTVRLVSPTFQGNIGGAGVSRSVFFINTGRATVTNPSYSGLDRKAELDTGGPTEYVESGWHAATPTILNTAGARLINFYGALGRAQTYATAAPTTGTWAHGDIVWNSEPSAGGTPGWVCVTAGTPGTWKAMANVAA